MLLLSADDKVLNLMLFYDFLLLLEGLSVFGCCYCVCVRACSSLFSKYSNSSNSVIPISKET